MSGKHQKHLAAFLSQSEPAINIEYLRRNLVRSRRKGTTPSDLLWIIENRTRLPYTTTKEMETAAREYQDVSPTRDEASYGYH